MVSLCCERFLAATLSWGVVQRRRNNAKMASGVAAMCAAWVCAIIDHDWPGTRLRLG